MIGSRNRLADLLGHPVDLIEEGTLRPRALKAPSREAVRAFSRSDLTFQRHR